MSLAVCFHCRETIVPLEIASYQTITRGSRKLVRPEISTLLYGKRPTPTARIPNFEAPTEEELLEMVGWSLHVVGRIHTCRHAPTPPS